MEKRKAELTAAYARLEAMLNELPESPKREKAIYELGISKTLALLALRVEDTE